MPGFKLESTEACCGEDDDVITEFFVVANFTLKEMDSCNYNIRKQDSKPVSCLKTVFHSHGESFVPHAHP